MKSWPRRDNLKCDPWQFVRGNLNVAKLVITNLRNEDKKVSLQFGTKRLVWDHILICEEFPRPGGLIILFVWNIWLKLFYKLATTFQRESRIANHEKEINWFRKLLKLTIEHPDNSNPCFGNHYKFRNFRLCCYCGTRGGYYVAEAALTLASSATSEEATLETLRYRQSTASGAGTWTPPAQLSRGTCQLATWRTRVSMQTESSPGVGCGHEDGAQGSPVIAPCPGQVSSQPLANLTWVSRPLSHC